MSSDCTLYQAITVYKTHNCSNKKDLCETGGRKCMCYCILDLMLNISLAKLFKGIHIINNELKSNLDGLYFIKYFGHRGRGLFPNSSSSSSKVPSIVIF